MAYIETVNQGNPGTSGPWPTTDKADGTPGSTVPTTAVQVAGSDGTDLRSIATDSAGQVKVLVEGGTGVPVTQGTTPWVTEDKADGTPGSAAPTTSIQVAGSDGTDLRTILTDSTGQQKVLIENSSAIATTDKADGTPGSAVPTTAAQVAGSDGTDLRAIATDSGGQVKVLVEGGTGIPVTQSTSPWVTKDNADGTPGSAIPATATQVAGSDGTDLRVILTDSTGQQKVLVENFPATQPISGTVVAEIEGHAGAVLDGTAGSPSTGVLTVQGVSGGTPAPVNLTEISGSAPGSGNPLFVSEIHEYAQGSSTSGQSGGLSQIATVTAAPTDTNGMTNPMTGDAQGCLRVNPAGQTGSFKTYTASATGTGVCTVTVPAGKKWVVKVAALQISTSSTAGTRIPQFYAEDSGGHFLVIISAGIGTGASNGGVSYTAAPAMPLATAITGFAATLPFPELTIGPGASVSAYSVSGGASGDALGLTVTVTEYND